MKALSKHSTFALIIDVLKRFFGLNIYRISIAFVSLPTSFYQPMSTFIHHFFEHIFLFGINRRKNNRFVVKLFYLKIGRYFKFIF